MLATALELHREEETCVVEHEPCVRAQLNKQKLAAIASEPRVLIRGVVLVTVSLLFLSLSLSLLTIVLIFVDESRIVTLNYVCYHTIPNYQLED